jgi:hypothetical protein
VSDHYDAGALAVIEIIKRVRAKHEAPLRHVEVGAAYVALNAVTHWGQTICSDVETEVIKHLMERRERKP